MTYLADLKLLTLEMYGRYAVEVVERFGFCPWARSARESGDVSLHVIFSADPDDFSASLAELSALHQDPATPDIALFIYPLLDVDRLAFEDHVRRLRSHAESPRSNPPAGLDAYAMAAFHPAAQADLGHPDRLVPFVRRSPDPTLQLVRKSALSSIKGLTQGTAFLDVAELSLESLRALSEPKTKPVRDRIGEQNLATVRDVGPAAIEAVLADIQRAREVGHQRLQQRYGQRGPQR